MNKPRIVIFGAGNIGRSFLAPVFTRGGYEAVFADVAPPVLEALKSCNTYKLIEKSDTGELTFEIGPVRGVDARDTDAVSMELNGADLCATCVGAGALPMVLRTIAEVSVNRSRPLDIILAENLKGAGEMARTAMRVAGIPKKGTQGRIGIVETSIGKMVPIMPASEAASDPLLSWAEPFNTLIVDSEGFIGSIPRIKDLMPVSPIAPWVSRKLYIHNFGHAAAAYLGNQAMPGAVYIWEVLNNPAVASEVEKAMRIAGEALHLEYPDVFTKTDISIHIQDLIYRFSNRALGDTVYRVGRDLSRKLHRNDRVIGAIALAMKYNLDITAALEVFRAALVFNAAGPEGTADEADISVCKAAADPAVFLKEIVGLDRELEPELTEILMDILEP